MQKGQLIIINGSIYEYDRYDKDINLHLVTEIDIDDEGNLTATLIPQAFTTEELKNNNANFTKTQWYGIVEHFIRQDYTFSDDDVSNIVEDIVGRCFAYGVPEFKDLPKYIADYLNR